MHVTSYGRGKGGGGKGGGEREKMVVGGGGREGRGVSYGDEDTCLLE